jgi:hypothetical protein
LEIFFRGKAVGIFVPKNNLTLNLGRLILRGNPL